MDQVFCEITKTVWYLDPQYYTIFTALLLGVVGIFQDKIRNWFFKPNISVDIKLEPPDCHKTHKTDKQGYKLCDCYYFRFKVLNSGNYKLEDVEAMVVDISKKYPNGEYKKLYKFLPLNLLWSHYREVVMKSIQPGTFKHLDLGHVIETQFSLVEGFKIVGDSKITFVFDTSVSPNNGSSFISPGEYRFKIVFSANNIRPIYKTYEMVIADNWNDNEKIMLEKNISIKEIDY